MLKQTRTNTSVNPFESEDLFAGYDSNPFEVAASEPTEARYVMMRNGPAASSEEFEVTDSMAVEVMILWGDNVQHVTHLNPPRDYFLGEEERANVRCDYFIPREKLGSSRAPLVLVGHGQQAFLVILPNAKGYVSFDGQTKRTFADLAKTGEAQPCVEVAGALKVALPFGSKAHMELGDLVFMVSTVRAGRKPAGGFVRDHEWTTTLYTGLSLAVHASLFAIMALFMPPIGFEAEAMSPDDQLYLLQQYMAAHAEKQTEADQSDESAKDTGSEQGGGTGRRAVGAEGSMGDTGSKNLSGAYGIKGNADPQDRQIARSSERAMASNFGLIGILNSGTADNGPTAPWGQDEALGSDPLSARGNMWGNSIMDAYGAGGLGLSGIGEGGNGSGQGVGIGSIGTIGRGAGLGDGQGIGNGMNRGLRGGHKVSVPRVAIGTTQVNGRLPAEVIQRIVRQNYGRFRVCYEAGLRSNPSLQGRVSVRFVIGRDGGVSNVSGAGSDLPDPNVVRCVTSAYYGLSFPQPEGGIVSVVYPIMFTPGN